MDEHLNNDGAASRKPDEVNIYELHSAGIDIAELNKSSLERIIGYTPVLLEHCENGATLTSSPESTAYSATRTGEVTETTQRDAVVVTFEADETHALLVHITDDRGEAPSQRSYRVSAPDAAVQYLADDEFVTITADQPNAPGYLADLETALMTGERLILQLAKP